MRSKSPPIFCPKRKIILDLLCRPSTPRRRKAVCLVSYQQVLPVCRRRRFCQTPRGRRCYFFCSIPLDVCRRRQLSKRHPISSCGSSHETLQHIRHLSAPGKASKPFPRISIRNGFTRPTGDINVNSPLFTKRPSREEILTENLCDLPFLFRGPATRRLPPALPWRPTRVRR